MHFPGRRTLTLFASVLVVAALTATPAALAAPGDLDANFATGGVLTAPFMTTFPGAEDSHTIAVDSQRRYKTCAPKRKR